MAKQIKLKSDESGALLPPDDDSFGNDKPNDSISAELGVDPDEPEDSEEEKEEMYGWALKAYSHDLERWQPQFQQIQDDLKFLAREHWPQSVIQARGPEKPTPVYDLTGSMVNKVANEARANPPGIIIRRLDDSENNEVADILQGHVRAIEDHSRATIAYEEAMRMTASCGYGVIAVEIEEEEGSFESEIKISKVDDVCSVVFDSDLTSEHDANHVFWLRSYSKDRAIEEFGEDCIPGPGITPVEYLKQWQKGDLVYIAQVWRKVSEPDTLLELVSDLDGSKKAIWATDMAKEPERYAGYKIGRRKDGNKPVVKYGIMSGRKMLHLQDWPGAKIPLVPVFGNRDQTSLGTMYSGLVRLMMDPNREYNYIKAQEIMAIAQAPQTPWIVARGSIDQSRLDWN